MEKLIPALLANINKFRHPSAFTIEIAVTFSFIMVIIFDFFGMNGRYISQAPWGHRLYVLVMILFINMIHQDLKDLVVDLRKSLLLMVGLCVCSNKTVSEFLLLTVVGTVIFGLIYLSSLQFSNDEPTSLHNNEDELEVTPQVGFLPCFGAAMFLFFICSYDSPPINSLMGELNQYDIATYIILYMFYVNHAAFYGLVVLLFIAFSVCGIRYYYNLRKGNTYITEGFGAGDLSFLPSFLALLGSFDFTFVFFTANIIVLLVHRNIQKYQNYKKWRQENGN